MTCSDPAIFRGFGYVSIGSALLLLGYSWLICVPAFITTGRIFISRMDGALRRNCWIRSDPAQALVGCSTRNSQAGGRPLSSYRVRAESSSSLELG